MKLNLGLLLTVIATFTITSSLPTEYGPRHALFSTSFGDPANATYDYVVVGGGLAGLTVASRLAETGKYSVAVIEAGSFYQLGNSNYSEIPAYCVKYATEPINPTIDWSFYTTKQKGFNGRSQHYTAGRTLGGGSARNFMAWHRGTKGFYQQWADMIDDQSYTYDKLLPYFKRTEHFNTPPSIRPANATPRYDASVLGTDGPIQLSYAPYTQPFTPYAEKALQEVGISPQDGMLSGTLNGSSWLIQSIDPTTVTRSSSQSGFLWEIGLKSTQLVVYPLTMAMKINFNSKKKATGVDVNTNGAKYILSARKEVIVSSGSFQSPHLLMVSGIGPADTLARFNIPVISNLPGVGQNMRDHVLGGPSRKVSVTTQVQLKDPKYLAAATKEYIQKRTGPLTAFVTDMLAWEKIPKALRADFSPSTNKSLSKFSADWPEIEIFLTSGYWGNQNGTEPPLSEGDIVSVVTGLVAPVSRGNVTISSASMLDPPVINPNWLSDKADQEVAVAAFKRARQILAAKALKGIVIGDEIYPGKQIQTDAEILNAVKGSFSTIFHASCTCAMGNASDPMAVLDSHARVYGVSGLRVVDNSAPPLLMPGHPQATIYALAQKIVDDILGGN